MHSNSFNLFMIFELILQILRLIIHEEDSEGRGNRTDLRGPEVTTCLTILISRVG